MSFQGVYSKPSNSASVEKLLSEGRNSMQEETISLSDPDSHQDEEAALAIASTRKRSTTSRYLKFLWNLAIYAFAIYGIYALVIQAAPVIQKHLPSKHVSLAESHRFEKVPLAHAGLDVPESNGDGKHESHHEEHKAVSEVTEHEGQQGEWVDPHAAHKQAAAEHEHHEDTTVVDPHAAHKQAAAEHEHHQETAVADPHAAHKQAAAEHEHHQEEHHEHPAGGYSDVD